MNEVDICNLVIEMMSEEFDVKCFGIEQRSSAYVSLICGYTDVFRVKYSDRTKWIEIRLAKEDMNVDDKRFEAQKNKKQFCWRATINDYQDIYNFKNELLNSCRCFGKGEYKPSSYTLHSKIEIGYKLD